MSSTGARARLARTLGTSSTARRRTAPTRRKPDRFTPLSRATQPNTSEKGRNSTQVIVPAPEDTPALIEDGTASCNNWAGVDSNDRKISASST
jgi:hypothetical protein